MNTKDIIIKEAREIFLKKGFKKANIRDIANEAEVSTGAIYGYFVNKENLFEAAIGPLPKEYYFKYLKSVSKIKDVNYLNMKTEVKKNHFDGVELFLDYVYADIDAWKLVVNGKGTNYNKHLNSIVEKEIETFNDFLVVLENANIPFCRPNKYVINSIISNLVDDLVAVIKLDMHRDVAMEYSKQIAAFFYKGCIDLLKIEF